jgi:alpha-mannosidase
MTHSVRLVLLLFALAGMVTSGLAQSPASVQQKRIYIANDDHTDFMWTADADTYGRTFVEMLDWHLKLADETATNEPAYRNRFNCDGSYWLWNYEQRKTPAEFARLIGRIKDGTISAPLNSVVSCYGGQPAEAVLRGLYYAGRLERRYELRFPLAVAMENQALPLGLASLFAGAGAQYSWRGICGCATRMDKKLLGERPREIYWWAGHDGQRVLLKWYSQAGPGLGGYWEAGSPAAAIQYVDGDAGFLRRYVNPETKEPFKIAGIFGYGGDDLARKTGIAPPPEVPGVPGLHKIISSPYCDHFHLIAQQQSNERRQVIVSNEQDFFADFEKTYGAALDSQSVTYGNEWDLYSASMSETSARAKRAVENLRSAELLAAVVSLKYPDFMKRHTAARDRAFNAIGLFWEHNWTADGPISRPQRAAWQELIATEIETYVNSLQGEAIVRLGGMIPRPDKANRFFVLNPLGWSRTQHADFAYTGSADIHVRDLTTGKDVSHQIVKLDGARHLRILASDVPSAGYKVFEILAGKGTAPTDEAATTGPDGGNVFENDAVKLVIERDGAIRSFIDKRPGNIELAASIDGLKLNDFAANSDDGESLRVENRGPVSVTVRARSEAGLTHTTAITLYRNSDRIDIRNEIAANFSDVRHWAFTFALKDPSLRTEEIGAINLNKLKSAGGDYADTHARYDYLTVNHFADFTSGEGTRGVTISNPDLAFAKLGHSTPSLLDAATPQLHILAGGQVDGSYLGIRAQNGQTHFLQRFALRPHGSYDQVAAMKFALEHQNPFVTGAVISEKGGAYPETAHSLLTVGDPGVLLWSLKVHEDGIEHGLVTRLWNLSEKSANTELSLTPPVATVHRTTHIETDLEAVQLTGTGTIPMTFAREQLQTYRLQLR